MREPEGTIGFAVKALPPEVINSVISQFPLKTQPRDAQARCTYLSVSEDTFMFALEMGLGKTKLSLDIVTANKAMSNSSKTLVICPPIVVRQWNKEVPKHSDLDIQLVDASTPAKRMEQIEYSRADVTVVAHTWLVAQFSKANRKSKGSFTADALKTQARLKEIFASFDILIVDESHVLRNPSTVGFKGYRKYLLHIPKRYLLTGTPVGNSYTGVWSQYYIMDKGETFGTSYYAFLSEYFNEYNTGNYIKYSLRKEKKAEFMEKFWAKCIRWEENECNDLPGKSYTTFPVTMHPEQTEHYDSLVVTDKEDWAGEEDPVFELMKVTAGIGYKTSPKLEAVKAIAEEVCIENKRQLIIWVWLRDESDYLLENLSSAFKKLRVECIKGEVKSTDKNRILDDWASGKVDVLIANQKSLGVGVDLYEANVAVFFSNNRSLIDRKQSEKRIHRTGQTRHCTYIDVVCEQTIDILNLRMVNSAAKSFVELTRDSNIMEEARRQRGK